MRSQCEVNTRHKTDCAMAFGRKDHSCPRCQELLAGSAPRGGWQGRYYAKRETDAEFTARLKAHDCKKSGCGSICVHFDW